MTKTPAHGSKRHSPLTRTNEEIRAEAEKGWRSGGKETPCGRGSTLRYTERIREWLPAICAKYGIVSVNDAGAGDLNWIRHVEWNVWYRAFDLVPRHPSVRELDITRDLLPPADAILCRMVFNHLGQERTDSVIQLFRDSGARYLITNHYDRGDREFHRVEIPWSPLEKVEDGHEDGCYIGIWKL